MKQIDIKQYDSRCACGQRHTLSTRLCIIESNCLHHFAEYLKEVGLSGDAVAIYDENTYRALRGVRPNAAQEIILDPEDLHADETAVDEVICRLKPCSYLIACGSGTIHDVTRYCAYRKDLPFVSVPTAASVDGFCSSVAAMTWYGHKKTSPAVAPILVMADPEVYSKAPIRLTRSGFGDMISKYVALAEWKIAHLLTGEHFCRDIYDMMYKATNAIVDSADGILAGKIDAYEELMYGLLLSGLAMQMLGSSRPASGAEHHISHFIEIQPQILAGHSDALHGEKVGVATLLVTREYHRLRSAKGIAFTDYIPPDADQLRKIYGDPLIDAIQKENEKDAAEGIRGEQLEQAWSDICAIIDGIPDSKQLAIYQKLGLKTELADIGLSEDVLPTLLQYSPTVRNRLTLMRLRKSIQEHRSRATPTV